MGFSLKKNIETKRWLLHKQIYFAVLLLSEIIEKNINFSR